MTFRWMACSVLVTACAGAPTGKADRVPSPSPSSAQVSEPAAKSPEGAPDPRLVETETTPGPDAGDPVAQSSAPDAAPVPPPPLPAGTTVLHIGDSFAGALGIELNRLFEAHGVRGILRYETSSYIPTWAVSKDLPKHLDRFRPDLVLITLGANELEVPDPEERVKSIQRLVARLGGRPCVWIAPPLWEGARDVLLPVIEQNCSPCVFMSSRELEKTLPRMKDNIHPSMQARKDWAGFVLDWLARHRDPGGRRAWDMRED